LALAVTGVFVAQSVLADAGKTEHNIPLNTSVTAQACEISTVTAALDELGVIPLEPIDKDALENGTLQEKRVTLNFPKHCSGKVGLGRSTSSWLGGKLLRGFCGSPLRKD
jgi:hypothetical protein